VTVLPKHLIASTGAAEQLIWRELPFHLPAVHLDMLWHERDGRSPAHRWLRKNLEGLSATAQKMLPQKSEASEKMEKIA
jgi:DNA-binding transcriptional LysR family regulator